MLTYTFNQVNLELKKSSIANLKKIVEDVFGAKIDGNKKDDLLRQIRDELGKLYKSYVFSDIENAHQKIMTKKTGER